MCPANDVEEPSASYTFFIFRFVLRLFIQATAIPIPLHDEIPETQKNSNKLFLIWEFQSW